MIERAPVKAASATADRIVDAALETLRSEGFQGATARAIAARGRFNQALIFYHFGSVQRLLLAALDRTSENRMERYRAAVAGAASFEDLVNVAIRIYREDLDHGHMTVVSEMIAGSVANPELRPEIMRRTEQWVEFVEEAIHPLLEASPFGALATPRQIAFGLVAFYCGVNLFTRLQADHRETDELFATAARVAPLLAPFFPPGARPRAEP